MGAELDHLFICVSVGAPEAAALTQFGLVEGAPNQHPGQGTACRRFFFRNAYLELLWVSDRAEAQAAPISRTGLWQHWAGRNAASCPFGFCFRPELESSGEPPFGCWVYHAPYLPEDMSIQVGNNSELLTEPGLFYLGFRRKTGLGQPGKYQTLTHSAGLAEITRLELIAPPGSPASDELSALISAGLIRLRHGPEYIVELGLDRESQGERKDFRPILPLILSW